MKRIAHRGNMASDQNNIENTLRAFQNALSTVDGIELDVHMTRDGTLIVFHDNDVSNLTGGTGNILDLDYDYITTLRVNGEKIPTLEQVFQLALTNKEIYVEIKQSERNGEHGQYPGIVTKVIQLIEKYKLEQQVIVISFDWYMLQESKEKNGKIKTGALLDENLMLSEFDSLCCRNSQCMERLEQMAIDYILFDYELFDQQTDLIFENYTLGIWLTGKLTFSPDKIKIVISDYW